MRAVRELVERWCAAYGDLDEKKLAVVESPDIETVDRFGEVHAAKQRPDEERFWAEGFEMIRRECLHPVCAIEEIHSTRPDVMIVHVEISYVGGIPLKGGDFISPFSKIHTILGQETKGLGGSRDTISPNMNTWNKPDRKSVSNSEGRCHERTDTS